MSSKLIVCVLTYVVVPFTYKFPVIVVSPPTCKFLAIPAPPDTISAPEFVAVLSVVFVMVTIPATLLAPPTFNVLEIPTPPATIKDPDVMCAESYVALILNPPDITKDPVDWVNDSVVSRITIGCSKYIGDVDIVLFMYYTYNI